MSEIDPALFDHLRRMAYQEFKLAAGHEAGVHPYKRGAKRPEGVILLVDNIPFAGHTTSEGSAVAEALKTLKYSLQARGEDASRHPVTFAIAAVGVSRNHAAMLKPSKDLLADLKTWPGAVNLRELEVFAAPTDDAYTLRLKREP